MSVGQVLHQFMDCLSHAPWVGEKRQVSCWQFENPLAWRALQHAPLQRGTDRAVLGANDVAARHAAIAGSAQLDRSAQRLQRLRPELRRSPGSHRRIAVVQQPGCHVVLMDSCCGAARCKFGSQRGLRIVQRTERAEGIAVDWQEGAEIDQLRQLLR